MVQIRIVLWLPVECFSKLLALLFKGRHILPLVQGLTVSWGLTRMSVTWFAQKPEMYCLKQNKTNRFQPVRGGAATHAFSAGCAFIETGDFNLPTSDDQWMFHDVKLRRDKHRKMDSSIDVDLCCSFWCGAIFSVRVPHIYFPKS